MRFHQQPAAFWVFSKNGGVVSPRKGMLQNANKMVSKWSEIWFEKKKWHPFFPKPRKYTKYGISVFGILRRFFFDSSFFKFCRRVGAFFLQILQSKDSLQRVWFSPNVFSSKNCSVFVVFLWAVLPWSLVFSLFFARMNLFWPNFLSMKTGSSGQVSKQETCYLLFLENVCSTMYFWFKENKRWLAY